MDFVIGFRVKAARERAWLVGDPAWMRRWLLERASAGRGTTLEIKSRFGARCLELAGAHASDLLRKAISNHWETEPRVSPGNGKESGRWTRLAGEVPSLGHNQGPSLDDKPEIPRLKPSDSQVRTRIAKSVANAARPKGKFAILAMIAAAGAKWLTKEVPSMMSYLDSAKSLEELQGNVSEKSWPGYQDHHVVEEDAGRKYGFSESDIQGKENLVRIPTYKHYEISGWYGKANDQFEGLTPRQYLSDKSWEERRQVGLSILRKFGVLAP